MLTKQRSTSILLVDGIFFLAAEETLDITCVVKNYLVFHLSQFLLVWEWMCECEFMYEINIFYS